MEKSLTRIANNPSRYIHAALIALTVAAGSNLCQAPLAKAQGDTTLRNPLIPGAYSQAPLQMVPEDAPPPIGDGDTPAPVTPGMGGDPLPPPSAVPTQPSSPLDQSSVDSAVAPYLTPPPSTPGEDAGLLPGTTSGYQPPALITNIQSQGGMNGNAPIHHWQGQATQDFGLVRTKGAQTTDFGQPLSQVAEVQPKPSEDGPRGLASNGAPAQPNLAGAQQTTDLYGNRTLFKGNQHAVMTIAPY